jgi:hypothetical protein
MTPVNRKLVVLVNRKVVITVQRKLALLPGLKHAAPATNKASLSKAKNRDITTSMKSRSSNYPQPTAPRNNEPSCSNHSTRGHPREAGFVRVHRPRGSIKKLWHAYAFCPRISPSVRVVQNDHLTYQRLQTPPT